MKMTFISAAWAFERLHFPGLAEILSPYVAFSILDFNLITILYSYITCAFWEGQYRIPIEAQKARA